MVLERIGRWRWAGSPEAYPGRLMIDASYRVGTSRNSLFPDSRVHLRDDKRARLMVNSLGLRLFVGPPTGVQFGGLVVSH